MRLLELFCGTASISKVFAENGHETITVDRTDRCYPDITIDILDILPVTWKRLKEYSPDIIWASPPCESFSVASIGRNWNKDYTPKSKKAAQAILFVERTIEIIEFLNPQLYFIENPVGMLRKLPMLQSFPLKTLNYCQYGDSRMKPTDIWTNADWTPKERCSPGDKCHEAAPRGSKSGTQGLKNSKERGRIPRNLCLEILKVCEGFQGK